MKAIVKRRAGPGAELLNVAMPKPGPREVLVKVLATSICGTDVHIYTWNEWAKRRIKPPLIMGHELAGEVVEFGDQVSSIKAGDYISAETHIPCGQCFQCKTGNQHICQNLRILGVDRDGAFAEYIALPEVVIWKNDRSIPPKFASIQEPLGNAIHAVLNGDGDGDIAGSTMAIFGAGTTGLFATGIAKVSGATEIYVVDQYNFRLDIAKRMGATETINFRQADVVKTVLERTSGLGVDIVLEMSGSQAAIEQGLKIVRRGGSFVAFGLPPKSVTMDLTEDVIFKEVKIIGITGRKMFDTWYKTANFLKTRKLDISPLITHELALDEFVKAMDLVINHPDETIKVVLYP